MVAVINDEHRGVCDKDQDKKLKTASHVAIALGHAKELVQD